MQLPNWVEDTPSSSQTSRFHWRRPGHSMSSLQLPFPLKNSCPRCPVERSNLRSHTFSRRPNGRIVLSVSTQSSHETNEVEGIEGALDGRCIYISSPMSIGLSVVTGGAHRIRNAISGFVSPYEYDGRGAHRVHAPSSHFIQHSTKLKRCPPYSLTPSLTDLPSVHQRHKSQLLRHLTSKHLPLQTPTPLAWRLAA